MRKPPPIPKDPQSTMEKMISDKQAAAMAAAAAAKAARSAALKAAAEAKGNQSR